MSDNIIPHMTQQTADGNSLNLEALRQICPQCFTEVKDEETGKPRMAVDFDKLRQFLGDNTVPDRAERYEFNWVGKQEAAREAAYPINKTLRPCKEESVDWDTTQNLYIEGDNLEVLKLLRKGYQGKVKMIYIDPPYNTGNDFIYDDNFSITKREYEDKAGYTDDEGNHYVRNTDGNGHMHSEWCSMMYSRLLVARTLLSDDGVIFISIDDNEVENLKKICDEIFGESCFVANFIWEKRQNRENRKEVSVRHDYVLCYSKMSSFQSTKRIYQLPMNDKALANYNNPDNDPRGLWKSDPAHTQAGHGTKGQFYTLVAPNGKKHDLPSGRCWVYTEKVMQEAINDNRIWFGLDGNGVPRIKTYLDAKERGLTPETLLTADDASTNENAKNDIKNLFEGLSVFDTPKPIELIQLLIRFSLKDGICLDFFSGSSASAHAVMKLNAEDGGNRKFIMVQFPEETEKKTEAQKAGYKNICEIGKERIRRAGKKVKEEAGLFADKLDVGFRVLKCDTSNMLDVFYSPKETEQTLLGNLLENIKEDRSDLDILFGCMLEWGVQLSMPLEEKKVAGATIYNVNDGDLVGCFSSPVNDNVINAMAELNPVRVVFRDSAFADDTQKINLFERFKQLCGWDDNEARNNIRVI